MSWIAEPELTLKEKKYIRDIETLFNVKNAKNEWVPYKLEPHQKWWHKEDVGLKGKEAKHKVVVKSRNTSFTVSSTISILMSVPFYPSQVVPVVRFNMTRATDLINDIKEIIKHMNVIKEKDGSYFPFNPLDVNMDSSQRIIFPNGLEIRAFPATNASAEIIRGLRIAGCAGLIDECNFMKDFVNIYIALRDASAGSIDGDREFQILIGTTRKGGSTKFNIWFEDIEKRNLSNFYIYKWPVVNPLKVDLTKPLPEQNLIPIVKWHDIYDLENKRKENLKTFKEEYMAMLVDSNDQFYTFNIISNAINIGEEYECVISEPIESAIYYIGIDVATGAGKDYFVISVFEKVGDYKLQRYLYYTREHGLPDMEEFCINTIRKWNPKKVRIDSVGVGTQISQKLSGIFGNIIEPTKGNMSIGGLNRKIPLGLNEFMHTNQRSMMEYNLVGLINDELQMKHYTAWNDSYKAESGENGHGDIVIANGLALLPDDWRNGKMVSKTHTTTEKSKHMEDNLHNYKQEEVAW